MGQSISQEDAAKYQLIIVNAIKTNTLSEENQRVIQEYGKLITTLNLHFSNQHNLHFDYLSTILEDIPELLNFNLHLQKCSITDKSVLILLEAVQRLNEKLITLTLNLSENSLTVESFQVIGTLVSQFQALKSLRLNLSQNQNEFKGIQYISDGLRNLKSIEQLSVDVETSEERSGDNANLAKIYSNLPNLKSLDVSFYRDKSFISALSSEFQNFKRIEEIGLIFDSSHDHEKISILLENIKEFKELKKFRLYAGYNNEMMHLLLQNLRQFKDTLISIDLIFKLTPIVYHYLLEELCNFKSLNNLVLQGEISFRKYLYIDFKADNLSSDQVEKQILKQKETVGLVSEYSANYEILRCIYSAIFSQPSEAESKLFLQHSQKTSTLQINHQSITNYSLTKPQWEQFGKILSNFNALKSLVVDLSLLPEFSLETSKSFFVFFQSMPILQRLKLVFGKCSVETSLRAIIDILAKHNRQLRDLVLHYKEFRHTQREKFFIAESICKLESLTDLTLVLGKSFFLQTNEIISTFKKSKLKLKNFFYPNEGTNNNNFQLIKPENEGDEFFKQPNLLKICDAIDEFTYFQKEPDSKLTLGPLEVFKNEEIFNFRNFNLQQMSIFLSCISQIADLKELVLHFPESVWEVKMNEQFSAQIAQTISNLTNLQTLQIHFAQSPPQSNNAFQIICQGIAANQNLEYFMSDIVNDYVLKFIESNQADDVLDQQLLEIIGKVISVIVTQLGMHLNCFQDQYDDIDDKQIKRLTSFLIQYFPQLRILDLYAINIIGVSQSTLDEIFNQLFGQLPLLQKQPQSIITPNQIYLKSTFRKESF